MKLNNTYIVLDSGSFSEHVAWGQAHKAISDAIKAMRWPDRRGVRTFKIPHILSIPVGGQYIDELGRIKQVSNKKKTLRNGVRPLRDQFRNWMAKKKWTAEEPLSLVPYFKRLRKESGVVFSKYPQTDETEEVAWNESVGDLDFWFKTDSGFRTVVEWETGNISSSHVR